ncbi:MAG: hypothetical protein ACR2P4_08180 [Gammaproteobacteria bacterium]
MTKQLRRTTICAALLGLAVLQAVILGALWAQVSPHPPNWVGPYLGAMIALAAASIPLVHHGIKAGLVGAMIVAVMAILSVGPQKFVLEANAAVLSPVLIVGTMLLVVVLVFSVKEWRSGDAG